MTPTKSPNYIGENLLKVYAIRMNGRIAEANAAEKSGRHATAKHHLRCAAYAARLMQIERKMFA